MKKHRLWKIVLLIPLVSIALFNLAVFLSPSVIVGHNEEYTIYDNQNEYAFSYHFYGLGKYINLNDISPNLIKSIIASEDQRFYSHHGFDYKRIIASIINNIKSGEIVEGGSTITQQLARTLFLNNEKSLTRKIKEAALARKIEMTYSKDKILEAYLNSVYFGHNIYGIDEASYYFFNKSPNALTLAESATLTGIISAPSYYSPDIDEKESTRKKEQILKIMFQRGDITLSEYEKALSEKLNYYFKKRTENNANLMYYFDAIKEQMEENNLINASNLAYGYEIKSSLDLEITNSVSKVLKSFRLSEEDQQVSIVIMRPFSGDVLCLLGGINYNNSPFNRAINSWRQTGSTIKPLLYYLALENGLDTTTQLISEPVTFHIENNEEYSPSNATNNYANGPINMVEALALSDNIYATKTLLLIGSDNLANSLKRFGVKNVVNNPTIGLGTNQLTPLQLASIYNCFASEGAFFPPQIIKEVTLKNGEVIYQNPSSLRFSLNRKSVLALNYMLLSPFDKSLTSYTTPSLVNYKTKYTFAAKTGSTNADSWVVGFNKNYTILVHVGTDNNAELKNGALAKQLFVSIADNLMDNKQDTFYEVPSDLKPFNIMNNGVKSRTYYSIY